MKHTPTPWKLGHGGQFTDVIMTEGGKHLFEIEECVGLGHEGKANAQFIVKAVNSHYELLEVCKCALADLEGFRQVLPLEAGHSALFTIKELRQVIAKAEGGDHETSNRLVVCTIK